MEKHFFDTCTPVLPVNALVGGGGGGSHVVSEELSHHCK